VPELANFGITALSSLFGAWIGASLAFQRYKAEKAFDRRLAWYETCFRALAQARKDLYQLVHALQPTTDPGALKERADAFSRSFEALADAMEDAVFYAPPATIETLHLLQNDFKSFTTRLASAPPSNVNDAQALVTLGAQFLLASRSLAADIRPHLGLGRLPPGIGPVSV